MDFESMTLEEFKKISLETFKKEYEIDWEKHCYNPKKHNCTGSCQGCSDCLFAQHFRGDIDKQPTREEMINSFLESEHSSLVFDKFMETDEGKEITRELKEDIKEYLGG